MLKFRIRKDRLNEVVHTCKRNKNAWISRGGEGGEGGGGDGWMDGWLDRWLDRWMNG